MDRLLLTLLVSTLLAAGVSAQPTPASYNRKAGPAAVGQITFATTPPVVGRQSTQEVAVELSLKTRTRRQREVLEEATASLTRRRQRVTTVTGVQRGLPTAARVHYTVSQRAQNDDPAESDAVAGKTYQCERRGKTLHVLNEQGEVPPPEEFEIVAENMALLGKPNPLAEFLAGKTVSVGQRVGVPAAVAQQLLGLDDQFGEVSRFDLILEAIGQAGGAKVARFAADLEATKHATSQMRLMIAGPLQIEAATCRVVSAELSGPIGMSQSRHDPQGAVQLDSTGRLSLRLASRRHDDQPQR